MKVPNSYFLYYLCTMQFCQYLFSGWCILALLSLGTHVYMIIYSSRIIIYGFLQEWSGRSSARMARPVWPTRKHDNLVVGIWKVSSLWPTSVQKLGTILLRELLLWGPQSCLNPNWILAKFCMTNWVATKLGWGSNLVQWKLNRGDAHRLHCSYHGRAGPS